MKLPLIRSAAIALTVAGAALTSVSCSTNGDPNTGGIFWNEGRAQDRLDERQDKLDNLEKRTRTSNNSAAARKRKIDALR